MAFRRSGTIEDICSTHTREEAIALIVENHLGEAVTLRTLHPGLLGTDHEVYEVFSKEGEVLLGYFRIPIRHINKFEFIYIHACRKANLPVPELIGFGSSNVKGHKFAYSFIAPANGIRLRDALNIPLLLDGDDVFDIARQAGKLLADFHKLGESDEEISDVISKQPRNIAPGVYSFGFLKLHLTVIAESEWGRLPSNINFLEFLMRHKKKWADDYASQLEHAERVPTHLDFHDGHIFVDPDTKQISGVIDFSDMEMSIDVLDLCYWSLGSMPGNTFDTFIKSYMDERYGSNSNKRLEFLDRFKSVFPAIAIGSLCLEADTYKSIEGANRVVARFSDITASVGLSL